MKPYGWFGLGLVSGIALTAVAGAFYARHQQTTQVASDVAHPPVANATGAMSSGPATAAGSMEAATEALRTRLLSKGGTDADWELLAQSYEFLGRKQEAALARQHKATAERNLQDAVDASAWMLRGDKAAPAPASGMSGSNRVDVLLAQAEEHRRKREFKQACDLYRKVISAGGMTADAWADYADALASSGSGSLSGEPARAIGAALKLDPRHPKALWLKASLAHEEHRYEDALKAWRELLALLPQGSSDARIVEANIAEAQRLAGPAAAPRKPGTGT